MYNWERGLALLGAMGNMFTRYPDGGKVPIIVV